MIQIDAGVVVVENLEELSLEEIEKAFFNPNKQKVLEPGYVSAENHATARQIANAEEVLQFRCREYAWQMSALDDATRKAILFEATARSYGEGEASHLNVEDLHFGEAQDTHPPTTRLADSEKEPPEVDANIELLKRVLDEPVMKRDLAFWPNGRLIHLNLYDKETGEPRPENALRFIIKGEESLSCQILDGTSLPIHIFNEGGSFSMEARGAAEEYLSFFCEHVMGSAGPFTPIEQEVAFESYEHPEFLAIRTNKWRESAIHSDKDLTQPRRTRAALAMPITRINSPDEPDARFIQAFEYDRAPFRAALRLSPDGMIEMLEDAAIPHVAMELLKPQWIGWNGPWK